jgi:hypothetical protein
VLAAGARDGAVQVAPARGLVLEAVDYPPPEGLAGRVAAARARRDAPGAPWQPRSMTETPRQSDAERTDPRAGDDELEVRDVAHEPQQHDGVLEMADINDDRYGNALLDEGISPRERDVRVGRYGMTADEELAGETIDQRLLEEEPDLPVGAGGADGAGEGDYPADEPDDGELMDDEVGYARAGRLVEPDQGAGEDTEKSEVATDVGIDGGAASAEEAAVHVVREEEDDVV